MFENLKSQMLPQKTHFWKPNFEMVILDFGKASGGGNFIKDI